MSLLILADDLTGAADCAARCHTAGMAATISLQPPTTPVPSGAIAFTSDSRHLPAVRAAQRVQRLVDSLSYLTDVVWYKKIDSTLRGNLGSELDAMLDSLGRRCAVICPAFPAQGRGLQDGYLVAEHLSAQPVHLPSVLTQQSRRRMEAISLADVRAGPRHLSGSLTGAQARHAQLLVVDALIDDDLQTIQAAVEQALPDALLCGSAGMAAALAVRQRGTVAQPAGELIPVHQGPITRAALIVVGSGSTTAHRQIDYLRRQCTVELVEAGLGKPGHWTGDVLLHLPEPRPQTALDEPDARARAAELSEAAHSVLARLQPALLVLVGGDTAISLLHRLGIQRLKVLREVLPGMPLTWGVDHASRGYHVILKAGNHGDEAALATLLQRARSELT